METMVSTTSQSEEESTEPVDMSQIYLQVVGGEKKRRVYGLGSQASAYYPEKFSSSSTTTSRFHFTSDEQFTQRVDEVVGQKVQELKQKMNEELQQKMNEDMRLYKEQVQREVKQQMEDFLLSFSQSQSNPQHQNFTTPASTPRDPSAGFDDIP